MKPLCYYVMNLLYSGFCENKIFEQEKIFVCFVFFKFFLNSGSYEFRNRNILLGSSKSFFYLGEVVGRYFCSSPFAKCHISVIYNPLYINVLFFSTQF